MVMKGQTFKEKKANSTRLYKVTRQYIHGRLIRKTKYHANKKSKKGTDVGVNE